jgi:hypothetical protein
MSVQNVIAEDAERPEQLSYHGLDLSGQFEVSRYLTDRSDAVALLVLAHQTHLHTLMTREAAGTRAALLEEKAIAQAQKKIFQCIGSESPSLALRDREVREGQALIPLPGGS